MPASTFEHFRNDPRDPQSLSSDVISVIFEDSHHQLWIGTGANGAEGSGLNRFDPATGKSVRYQHEQSDPQSLSSKNIASIYEAGDGTLWIATGGFSLHGGGLNQFYPETGKLGIFDMMRIILTALAVTTSWVSGGIRAARCGSARGRMA